jgi:hypothetical protein
MPMDGADMSTDDPVAVVAVLPAPEAVPAQPVGTAPAGTAAAAAADERVHSNAKGLKQWRWQSVTALLYSAADISGRSTERLVSLSVSQSFPTPCWPLERIRAIRGGDVRVPATG